jgi:hypothetical protein
MQNKNILKFVALLLIGKIGLGIATNIAPIYLLNDVR